MAYLAKLDENNIVLHVSIVSDDEASAESGQYKQTKKDGSFRKNHASPGYTYDESRDAFIAPKKYNSWILNEDTCRWEPPVSYPDDGGTYSWNENNQAWDETV